ncbi:MAG: hypothetical protein ACR2N4_06010 [Jatrophihabitans sp.]
MELDAGDNNLAPDLDDVRDVELTERLDELRRAYDAREVTDQAYELQRDAIFHAMRQVLVDGGVDMDRVEEDQGLAWESSSEPGRGPRMLFIDLELEHDLAMFQPPPGLDYGSAPHLGLS